MSGLGWRWMRDESRRLARPAASCRVLELLRIIAHVKKRTRATRRIPPVQATSRASRFSSHDCYATPFLALHAGVKSDLKLSPRVDAGQRSPFTLSTNTSERDDLPDLRARPVSSGGLFAKEIVPPPKNLRG